MVDNYHGTEVKDPYRWLEDDNSAETKAWVAAENAVTRSYLKTLPQRDAIRERLKHLWNYERVGLPEEQGDRWFFTKNSGLQNQSVLYTADSLDDDPRILLDPNTLSADGTVSLAEWEPSEDGKLLAYATSGGGSDWRQIRVRDIAAGKDREDVLKWVKFSGISWTKDDSGFFYSRYDAPADGAALTQKNQFQKLYFHPLGKPQGEDTLVYRTARPARVGHWRRRHGGREISHHPHHAGDRHEEPGILQAPRGPRRQGCRTAPERGCRLQFSRQRRRGLLFHDGSRRAAASGHRDRHGASGAGELEGNHPASPGPTGWREQGGRQIHRHLHEGRAQPGDPLRQRTGKTRTRWSCRGSARRMASGERRRKAAYSTSSPSFTEPGAIYRLDIATGESTLWKKPEVGFDGAPYETEQVFYTSKDGTKVPMFIVHKKGLKLDGTNPTLLYGYGGFQISLHPGFSVHARRLAGEGRRPCRGEHARRRRVWQRVARSGETRTSRTSSTTSSPRRRG